MASLSKPGYGYSFAMESSSSTPWIHYQCAPIPSHEHPFMPSSSGQDKGTLTILHCHFVQIESHANDVWRRSPAFLVAPSRWGLLRQPLVVDWMDLKHLTSKPPGSKPEIYVPVARQRFHGTDGSLGKPTAVNIRFNLH